MRGRHQQRAPVRCNGCIASPPTRGRHQQRAPVFVIGCTASPCSRPSNGPSCHTSSISSRGYYLRWLWCCCRRQRQRRPSHHRPRWCLCRLVLAVPTSTFSFAAASTFPVATATAAFSAATPAVAAAGEHSMASMASVGPLLPVSRKSVVPLSYSLDGVITADTVTRYKIPCLHLVFGRQSVDKDCV